MRTSFALSRLTMLFAFSGALLARSPSAHACSGVSCADGEVFPRSGEVPANALVFFVRDAIDPQPFLEHDGGVPVELRQILLQGRDAGAPLALESSEVAYESDRRWEEPQTLLTPTQPLAAGTVVLVKTYDACLGRAQSTQLLVTEAAPKPETLGELAVITRGGPLHLWTGSASCTQATFTMSADVKVHLADEAVPYADILRYHLLVDGERFASDDWAADDDFESGRRSIAGSVLGAGIERVYALCDTSNEEAIGTGVEPGPHTVRIVALLPDGSSIESDDQQIDLTCPKCEPVDGGANCRSIDDGDAGTWHPTDTASSPEPDERPDVTRNDTEEVDPGSTPDVPPSNDPDAATPNAESDAGKVVIPVKAGSGSGSPAPAVQDSGVRSGEGDQNKALADADDSDSGCSFSAKRSAERTDHGGLTSMLGALGLGLALRRRVATRARS